jgi:hypothetical protein
VPAGSCKLPTVSAAAHVDRVDLPVALHRLTDRRRPGRVDRPQALAQVDLVGIERNDVAWSDELGRVEQRSGRHV